MHCSAYIIAIYGSTENLCHIHNLVSQNFCLTTSVLRHFTPTRRVYNEITSLRHQRLRLFTLLIPFPAALTS
jgi:hypothetical protein